MSGDSLTESHQVRKQEGSASEEPSCPPQGPENDDSGPLNSCHEASFLRLFEGCFSSALPKSSPGIARAKQGFREPQVKKMQDTFLHLTSICSGCCPSFISPCWGCPQENLQFPVGPPCCQFSNLPAAPQPSGNCLTIGGRAGTKTPVWTRTLQFHISFPRLLLHLCLSAFPVFSPLLYLPSKL